MATAWTQTPNLQGDRGGGECACLSAAGLVPKTLWGKIAAGAALLVLTGATIAAAFWARNFLLHDAHFVVPNSESIQIAGNSHLTRAQLLSVFGEDVDRNIFNLPLAERRAELESLPWVAHATVMRLLPNRVRVAIVERTPVAFVRQGAQIGLVDANGVLFDLPGPESYPAEAWPGGRAGGGARNPHYSFPVLTGISAGDPLSTRAARMKIYLDFMAALDATGEGISHKVSEVDVSNPEDVKAILPDGGGRGHPGALRRGEVFGALSQYQAHLAEWRRSIRKLASVDMRYERQVVLEMQPGTVVPNGDAAPAGAAAQAAAAAPAKAAAAQQAGVAASEWEAWSGQKEGRSCNETEWASPRALPRRGRRDECEAGQPDHRAGRGQQQGLRAGGGTAGRGAALSRPRH